MGWEDHRWHMETGLSEKGFEADVNGRFMKDTGGAWKGLRGRKREE